MISKDLIDILVCPESHQPLRLADDNLIRRINDAVDAAELRNSGGSKVEQPLDGGLVREDNKLVYPIVDEIPVLLTDEAIPLDQLDA